ncbi:hypothetical protein MACK_003696 [Theileria orientalis]|uniref:Uncharacterized protein n=1 Tax=Theileria orientalis TaxID=68886 RepID=A0A976SJM5_THEOR|nr:hypothetical protein MACK_003696 [Theileria orientalis]
MKINTISAYVLVYLLAHGHWNLMVPVRADVEGDSSSGSASADGGSSSTGGSLSVPAGGSSSPTRARSKAGSSAGSTASSTAGSDVANLASLDSSGADGSSAAPEGSSASPDAGLSGGDGSGVAVPADGASSGDDSTDADAGQAKADTVIFNGLYPDFHTSGVHVHDYAEVIDQVFLRKREEAKRLADEARRAADEAKRAADEMLRAAEEMSEAIDKAGDAAALEAEMKKLTTTVDAKVYQVNVARSELDAVANPLDWTYYSGFPSGHHHRATDETLIKMYKLDRMANNEMWRVDFPNGWHGLDFGGLDMMEKEAKKYRDEKYKQDSEAKRQQILAKQGEIMAKDKQIADKDDELKHKKEAVDVKNNELEVKRREITELREVINEFNRQLRDLENKASVLYSDHSKLFAEYKVLELGHKKLEDDRAKLLLEHKKLEDEDSKIVTEYYQLSGSTSYLDGKFKEKEISFDPRDNFTSFTEELGLVEAGEGEVKPKDYVYINPADTFSEHPLYTGASLSGGSAAPGAEAEVGESVHESLNEPADASSEAAVPQPAEAKAEAAEAAPAAEDHVASTPVAAPETHVADAGATPLAEGTSSGEAKAGAQSTPPALRLFKTDDNGNDVELVENTDYEKKHVSGDDKYEFKDGVMCAKVMFGEHLLWKKGDHNVHEPKKVGFNGTVNAVVVSDNERTVVYKKEDNSEQWRHIKTVERKSGHGHGRPAAHTGSPASSTPSTESAPAPGSLTTPLTGSTMNLASASTGSSEAEEKSSVTSESSDNGSESGSGSGLRGA